MHANKPQARKGVWPGISREFKQTHANKLQALLLLLVAASGPASPGRLACWRCERGMRLSESLRTCSCDRLLARIWRAAAYEREAQDEAEGPGGARGGWQVRKALLGSTRIDSGRGARVETLL